MSINDEDLDHTLARARKHTCFSDVRGALAVDVERLVDEVRALQRQLAFSTSVTETLQHGTRCALAERESIVRDLRYEASYSASSDLLRALADRYEKGLHH